jgi:hypothetical protein
VGTPLFMAPEQVLGEGSIQPSADLYALAHVAYCLLAGEPYWTEDAEAHDSIMPMLKRVLGGPAEPPSARAMRRKRVVLPASFDAWFSRAAAVDAGARFASATSQIDALRAVLLQPQSGPLMSAPSGSISARSGPGVDAAGATLVDESRRPSAPGARPATPSPFHPPSAYAQSIDTTQRSMGGPPLTVVQPPMSGYGTRPEVAAQTLAVPAPRPNTGLIVGGVVGALVLAGAGVGIFFAVSSSKAVATASATARGSTSVAVTPTPGPSQTSISVVPPPASSSSLPPYFAMPCPPNAKCVELRVPSFSAVPVEDVFAQTLAFARSIDPDARLFSFTVAKVRANGLLDFVKEEAATAIFTSQGSMVNFTAAHNLIMMTPSGNAAADGGQPDPCPYKTALAVALDNVTPGDLLQAAYSASVKPMWTFVLAKGNPLFIDGATCKLTSPF